MVSKLDMKAEQKKSIIGPVISVFVMVLVIAILSGLTFLFLASLATQTYNVAPLADSTRVVNETITPSTEGTALSVAGLRDCAATVEVITNSTAASSHAVINSGNYTVTGCTLANVTGTYNTVDWNVTYSYVYRPISTAESSVNSTSNAGYQTINYLPLIFLAVIFGALLTLVLKIILPYVNLGQSMNSF